MTSQIWRAEIPCSATVHTYNDTIHTLNNFTYFTRLQVTASERVIYIDYITTNLHRNTDVNHSGNHTTIKMSGTRALGMEL
jgi:hypothetical protein